MFNLQYKITVTICYYQEWTLELEEVFSLEREGEFDKFASYREKLDNRMLLWHGKWLFIYIGEIDCSVANCYK